ncbi:Glucose-methanol-choline oxidoreductase [Penicillium concentricum]|uniref:glucose oxidase n=1 Tax=Penicillium concentricum TaxID=293559 RepID=A0A9W9UWP6_9EURO|nr:Glucose-methanol-choline oxidoreductase [Penicillium concentricum]KAJ5360177.1 Glucose-methanol-choline oxidoreductase [Penicillium concentricum]
MRPSLSATIVGASLIANQFASALSPRTEVDDSYDFVIVGGGQAGLVLGARLSEDKNHTVLVLESGGDGDEFRKRIDTPAYSYFDSLWTTPLNWDFYTVAQPNADDREINWPRGKVLGGSSAINGLYMTRPGEDEINAWKDMLDEMDGADKWSWASFYAAMKKSETFTPPTDDVVDEARITWNATHHGTDGPIHATYPDYTFPEVGDWLTSLESIGIDISDNMYGGEAWGADLATSCINPANWTRSYSRSGYLDPLPERDNYDVLANAHVTRLIFEDSTSSDKTASAVEYTTDKGSTKLKVKVNKEVILAGGTIGSPAVLLYSGVGPKDVLSEAGIDLVSELPGVGQHLQDHFSATVKWSTNVDTAGSIFYDGGKDKNNPKFLTYIDSAVAYVNSTAIYGSKVDEYESKFLASIDQYVPNTTYDDGVVAGYKAICNTTASKIFNSPTGQIELLFMNSDGNGDIGITAALQHPFSHGRIYINSSDPMDYPVIDPNYLNNPADYEILLEGIKLARKLGETSPMSKSLTKETTPGSTVQSDEDWVEWLRKEAGTEFHPSSSCAMLPEKQGGVVDAKLRVYGLANVRVADASIIPISLSTHLMSSTYGVAEQASDIIREYHNAVSEPEPAFSSSGSTGSTSSSSSTPASSAVAVKKSGSPKSNGSAAGNGGAALSLVWTSLVLVSVHAIVGYGVFV